MIKSVTVVNNVGDSLKIDIFDTTPQHGLIIKNIDGLGPVKATINTDKSANSDGEFFNSSKLEKRNIVIDLHFFDTYKSVEDIRLTTYKYFPVKKNVTLYIETDNRYVKTVGYVESNEPEIWSDMEGCSISIICPDPGLYRADGIEYSDWLMYSVTKLFYFPFHNDSTSEKQLQFGSYVNDGQMYILYDGENDIGFTININFLGNAKNITLYNYQLNQRMIINTDKILNILNRYEYSVTTDPSFVEGKTYYELVNNVYIPTADTAKDPNKTYYEKVYGSFNMDEQIEINTVQRQCSAYFIDGTTRVNILSAIDRTSNWLKLRKGYNVYTLMAEEGFNNIQLKIVNRTSYGGV